MIPLATYQIGIFPKTYVCILLKGEDMAQERTLTVGRYYWVAVKSSRKAAEWQPARFTGIAGDSVGPTWDFIGFNTDVGHHFVDVVDVGPEIQQPGLESQYGAGDGMMAVSDALRIDEEAAP